MREASRGHYHGPMKTTVTDRIVVLFDCHNFSIVQTELGARSLEFMDEMYRRIGECVVSHGGRILKYVGDAMFALFPADSVRAAVEAARCARSEYAKQVADARFSGRIETELEVGISSGELTEGEVGHESFRCFDVAGETINEAAMIGHHRGIAIADSVRRLLPEEIEVRRLDDYQPKWRSEPLVVWEVVEA